MRTLDEILAEFKEITSASDLINAEAILKRDQTLVSTEFFDEAIQNLNNQTFSHLVIWFLNKKLSIEDVDIDKVILQALEYLMTCPPPTIQENSHLYCGLCIKISEHLVKVNDPKKGILFLMKSISAIQTSSSQMTSIHQELFKLCLLAKYPTPALRFLDEDISDIHKDETSVQDEYYLLYFYYGGMIYSSLGNFSRAFYCFHSAITLSHYTISDIQVAAAKKYILTALLINEPKAVFDENVSILKKFREISHVQPYFSMAESFKNGSIEKLRSWLGTADLILRNDRNMGLAKQVVKQLITVKIQNLNKPFKTLSLQDLAQKVQLSSVEEAERLMFQMIEDGKVFATINKQNGMVTFLDNAEKFNTPEMYCRLEADVRKCIALNDKFKQLEEDILTNPKYQQKPN